MIRIMTDTTASFTLEEYQELRDQSHPPIYQSRGVVAT